MLGFNLLFLMFLLERASVFGLIKTFYCLFALCFMLKMIVAICVLVELNLQVLIWVFCFRTNVGARL